MRADAVAVGSTAVSLVQTEAIRRAGGAIPVPGWAGIAVLALGALYYVVLRPAAIGAGLVSAAGIATVLGSLPTFLHVCAFALLTSVVAATDMRGRACICSAWVGIDALFEMAQHALISPTLAVPLEHWCGALAACRRTSQFFVQGTFDPADLIAGVIGGLAAFSVLRDARSTPELTR